MRVVHGGADDKRRRRPLNRECLYQLRRRATATSDLHVHPRMAYAEPNPPAPTSFQEIEDSGSMARSTVGAESSDPQLQMRTQ